MVALVNRSLAISNNDMKINKAKKKKFDKCVKNFKDEWHFRLGKRTPDDKFEYLVGEFCHIAYMRDLEPSVEKKREMERTCMQALGY